MFKNVYIVLFFVVLTAASCSEIDKIQKSSDIEYKYNKAIEFYENQDYEQAQVLLDELVIIYVGTEKAEKLHYYYAYTFYAQGNYIMASYHFKNFIRTYPRSEYKEECTFLSAYCKYLDSPDYSLDQSSTQRAITELQLFMNTFPESTRIEECNTLIDELRARLELKAYDIAVLYYNMEEYKAAITAFRNLFINYPSTPHKEEGLYTIFISYYKYAKGSVVYKKAERYADCTKAYETLRTAYPESKFLKKGLSMYESANYYLENN